MTLSRSRKDLARVKIGGKEGKWGFIDTEGTIVINPQFDDAGPFSEGLAHVIIDSKGGFIDTKGQYVSNPQFDSAWDFSEGLARVRIGGKEGFVDIEGNIVINPSV